MVFNPFRKKTRKELIEEEKRDMLELKILKRQSEIEEERSKRKLLLAQEKKRIAELKAKSFKASQVGRFTMGLGKFLDKSARNAAQNLSAMETQRRKNKRKGDGDGGIFGQLT